MGNKRNILSFLLLLIVLISSNGMFASHGSIYCATSSDGGVQYKHEEVAAGSLVIDGHKCCCHNDPNAESQPAEFTTQKLLDNSDERGCQKLYAIVACGHLIDVSPWSADSDNQWVSSRDLLFDWLEYNLYEGYNPSSELLRAPTALI